MFNIKRGINMKNKFKKTVLLLLVIVLALALTSCVPGDGTYTANNPAGFLWGIWHGWVSPISLIIGIFDPGIRVYEINNTGWWYDFGFYMAIISGFGGLSLNRHQHSKKRDGRD
jgi:hypothetical protein